MKNSFLYKITRPHPTITDPIERKIAQMVAGLHLFAIPLAPISLCISIYTGQPLALSWEFSFFAGILSVLNYFIARSKWFYYFILMQIVTPSIEIYYCALLVPERQSVFFAFLIPVLLSGILMSLRGLIWTSIFITLGMLSLLFFLDPVHHNTLIDSMYLILILLPMIVVMRIHQNSIEELRHLERDSQKEKLLSLIDRTFDGTAILKEENLVNVSEGFSQVCELPLKDSYDSSEVVWLTDNFLDKSHGFSKTQQVTLPSGEVKHIQWVREQVASDEYILAIRDVTADQKRKANQMILYRMTTAGNLAAGIAHELNTPLMVIMNHLHAIRNKPELFDDENVLRRLEISNAELSRMASILRDLKWFVDSKESPTEDVNEAISHIVRLAKHHINDQTKIKLELNEVFPIVGSESQLSQIMLILIFNAAESNAKFSEAFEIIITTKQHSEEWIEISIQDNGEGIPQENQDLIFEPFFTTRAHGTGLGLSICQTLVFRSGGKISVESKINNGTIFKILLPCTNELGIEPKVEAVPFTPKRILLIDDEPNLQEVLQEMLLPHKVSLAGHIDKAVELLDEREFDLIICDVILPRQGPVELVEYLIEKKSRLRNRILCVTGGIINAQIRYKLQQLNVPILFKPFTRDAVLKELQVLMKQ